MRSRLLLPTFACTVALGLAVPTSAQTTDDIRPSTLVETIQAPFLAARNWVIDFFVQEDRAVSAAVRSFGDMLRSDFDQFSALIEQAGFSIQEVDISGGLFPEFALILGFREQIKPDAKRQLIDQLNQLRGILGAAERAIILALLDVDRVVESFRPDGFVLQGVEIDVDLVPALTWMFVPANSSD